MALKNAHRLALDAQLMLGFDSYPTAASLAILSIEEVGKVGILRSFALARSADELRTWWRRFRTHTWKSNLAHIPTHPLRNKLTLASLAEIASPDGPEAGLFNVVKQIGFYTDFIEGNIWMSPEAMIDERLATGLVPNANQLCRMRDVTNREMELWFSIVGMAPRSEILSALVCWHAKMVEEGLVRQPHDQFERFILSNKRFILSDEWCSGRSSGGRFRLILDSLV